MNIGKAESGLLFFRNDKFDDAWLAWQQKGLLRNLFLRNEHWNGVSVGKFWRR